MPRKIYPTVTSVVWHPPKMLKDSRRVPHFIATFEEALEAQTWPKNFKWPQSKVKKWKWLAEAFPPKFAEWLFNKYVKGKDHILLDLFAGIGGWTIGAFWSKKVRKATLVEIDNEKCYYLRYNLKKRLGFNVKVICKDVRKFEPDEHYTIVVGSPPCEDVTQLKYLSLIKRKSPVGTYLLTKRYLEIVETVKPAYAFYENVWDSKLANMLRKHGFIVMKMNMSFIIPQKRVRLIAIRTPDRRQMSLAEVMGNE